MTPLPIFRLPQLVYIKIINQMNPAEQLLTALCSRKAYALVRNHRSKAINLTFELKPYSIYFFHEQEQPSKWLLQLSIGLESTWNSKKEEKSIDIHKNRGLRYTMDNRHGKEILKMCWKDQSVGLKNMLDLACDLFRIVNVDYIQIEGREYMWIFDWFKEQQKTLEILFLGNKIPDDDIKRVILNNTAQQLYMHARPTEDFQIQTIANTFGLFSCFYGSWITIDNLIELDCIELRIRNKNFSCSEINRFLKHWINGGSSRLKYLVITVVGLNQNEIFADIQNHLTRVPEERVYTSPYNTKTTFNGPQLRRNDGQVAYFRFTSNLHLLYMGVWSNAREGA